MPQFVHTQRMRAIAVLSLAVVTACALPQTTPKQGSKERKAILDAIRPKIEKTLKGQKVIFKVNHMKVKDNWAFVYGWPQRSDGKPISYKGTEWEGQQDSGAFDSNFCGLLKLTKGKWTVKDWAFGFTDVAWWGWWDNYKAPKSIFPSTGG